MPTLRYAKLCVKGRPSIQLLGDAPIPVIDFADALTQLKSLYRGSTIDEEANAFVVRIGKRRRFRYEYTLWAVCRRLNDKVRIGDLEEMMQLADDQERVFHHVHTSWYWYNLGSKSKRDTWRGPFSTFLNALKDAVKPFMGE